MNRETECRHCATRNRVDVDDAIKDPGKARCGRCKGALFLGPDEPFTGIDPRAYEHPLDRQALAALRKVPGTGTFLKFLLKHGLDRTYRLLMKQNYLEVRGNHVKRLHRIVENVSGALDLGSLPETYIVQQPVPNAWTTGVERFQLCLTTGLIELLDERELRAVIAHEVGHMQAGHVLYKTAAAILYYLVGTIASRMAPMASPLLLGMYFAFRKWERCAELTADRAELLVGRSREVCLAAHLKLASGSPKTNPDLDVERLLEQAREVEEISDENWLDQLIVAWQQAAMTHPFLVWRAKHLDEYSRSADLWDVLSGRYARRKGPPRKVPADDIPDEKPGKVRTLIEDLKKIFE